MRKWATFIGAIITIVIVAILLSAPANSQESVFIRDDWHAVRDGKKLFDVFYTKTSFMPTSRGTYTATLLLVFTEFGLEIEGSRKDKYFAKNVYAKVVSYEFNLISNTFAKLAYQYMDKEAKIIGERVIESKPEFLPILRDTMSHRWSELVRLSFGVQI